MFDVFYQDRKPDLFAFEKSAASLEDAAAQSRTEYFWFVHGNNDYAEFNFDWRPVPWEKDHVHVFPSQWQRNGEVYFARKWTAANKEYHFRDEQQVKRLVDMSKWSIPDRCDVTDFDFSWHPDAIEEPYEYRFPTQWQREGGPIYKGTAGIKYCNSQKVKAKSTQIFYMDFMNPGSQNQLARLKLQHPDIKSTRYVSDHLTVFKRIVNLATTEYVWIISSVCDYSRFDFTWHPDESQREMIHCFPSGDQKRGDTFLIHVQSFKNQMYTLELLDWFNVINYVKDITTVERFDMPVHYYQTDDLISEIKKYEFKTPYVMFNNQFTTQFYFQPCLWTEKDRVVTSFTHSNSICAVPRDVKAHLRTQMYDYPYVEDTNDGFYAEKPLDIVYISNGEPDEDFYYRWLKSLLDTEWAERKIHWIKGVNGRTQAYQAAAQASTTPWFLTVFAKLKVDKDFDFRWQPDYFQQPKHYIFHAKNPVNGLEYGHQAMIAYNKRLVLENNLPGLDFTLSQEHEVVPVLSGTAMFNQSEWMTWRTAFREVLKLQQFQTETPTIENKRRLNVWLTRAEGAFAEYCLAGARDAVAYYNEVKGDYDKLKLSYEWAWLQDRFSTTKI